MVRGKMAVSDKTSKRKSPKGHSKNVEHLEEFPIHAAILDDDLGTLEGLISKGADVNEHDKNQDTPLILAIKENKPNMVAKLLEEGADSNKLAPNKQTPLALASLLEHRECIDMLMQHGTSATPSRDDYVLSDKSSEFIEALSALLKHEMNLLSTPKNSVSITEEAIGIAKKFLNIQEIVPGALDKMTLDISTKITQALANAQSNTKAILKLCRRIVVVMQNHKHSFATELAWGLNKIESMLEEKIISQTEDEIPLSYNALEKKIRTESWYSKNGYVDLADFVSKNQNNIEALKYLEINKQKIQAKLQKGSMLLDVIVISPHTVTQSKELAMLLPGAMKRLKDEAEFGLHKDFNYIEEAIGEAKKAPVISPEASNKIDSALRPGRGLHIIHFHHDDEYEKFWADFAAEAFITGAKIFLFHHASHPINNSAVCCGLSIIDHLLENEVHPDKIVLQGYGAGILAARELGQLFLKQGIEFAQVGYLHPKFQFNDASQAACNLRALNICNLSDFDKKSGDNLAYAEKYAPFAKYISKLLRKTEYSCDEVFMTKQDAKAYPLAQLINFFFKTNQHFLHNNASYRNPALPLERVQVG